MQIPSCPHIRGNLYYGEIATEVIDEIQEFQAVCLVSHPEDKRCVIELSDDNRSEEDKFAKLVKFLDLHLPPLQRFSVQSILETREREDITKVGRNQPCSDEYCQDGFSNETVNTLRTIRIHRDFRAGRS